MSKQVRSTLPAYSQKEDMSNNNAIDNNNSIDSTPKVETAMVLLNLKPIRDLASNFDIDIASCLEDYLQELSQIGNNQLPISNNTTINSPNTCCNDNKSLVSPSQSSKASSNFFAQAALVLQSSSCVYSRKVEYLYDLVCRAVTELVASQNNLMENTTGGRSNRNKNGRVTEIEKFESFDSEMKFLLMDDVLPIDSSGSKISLKEDQNSNNLMEEEFNLTNMTNHNNTTAIGNINKTKLSLGRISDTTGIVDPISLFSPLNAFSKKNSVAAMVTTRALFYNLGSEAEGTGGLRLMNGVCDIASSGALMMPGSMMNESYSNAKYVDLNSNIDNEGYYQPNFSQGNEDLMDEGGGGGGFSGYGDEEYDDDHVTGLNLCSEYNDASNVDMNPMNDSASVGEQVVATQCQHQDAAICNNLVDDFQNGLVTHHPNSPQDDTWAFYDVHDASSTKNRPIRIGTTYSLPDTVDAPPSASVSGSRTIRASKVRKKSNRRNSSSTTVTTTTMKKRKPVGVSTFENIVASERRRSKRLKNIPINGPDEENMQNADQQQQSEIGNPCHIFNDLVFGDEFRYILNNETKRRAKERRERRKLIRENPTALIIPLPLPSYPVTPGAATNVDGDIESDVGDFGCDAADNNDNFGWAAVDDDNGNNNMNGNHNEAEGNTSIATFNGCFAYQEDGAIDNNFSEVWNKDTFEQLCRAHIQAFTRGVEKYAAETKLSVRVSRWQKKLIPIIEEYEARPVFDVREYSKVILHSVDAQQRKRIRIDSPIIKEKYEGSKEEDDEKESQITITTVNTTSFNKLTENLEQYEVCRVFFVSLLLANSGNISLIYDDNCGDQLNDSVTIELLDDELQIPSESFIST